MDFMDRIVFISVVLAVGVTLVLILAAIGDVD